MQCLRREIFSVKCNGVNSNAVSGWKFVPIESSFTGKGGYSVFSVLTVLKLFTIYAHHFFLFFNRENLFFLWFTKLVKYFNHILLKLNEIGHYSVLPCLLMYWIVPYTTMLMLVVFIIPNLQLILHRSYFLHKKREIKDEAVSRLLVLRRWQIVLKVFRKWMVE